MRTWSGMILTIVFLVAAALHVTIFSLSGASGWISKSVQEILAFCALLAGIIWVNRQFCFENMGLVQKLRLLSGLVLFFWGIIKLVSGAYPLEIYYDTAAFGRSIIWLALQISLAVIVCLLLLCILKTLVFVQPGRGTSRSFMLMMIMVFTASVSSFFYTGSVEDLDFGQAFFFSGNPFQITIQIVLAFSALIIGFRCKWIHYLNKTQKLSTTGLGIGLMVLLFSLIPYVPGVAMHYSYILCYFIKNALLVFIIYGNMALLGLLLQLPSAGLMDRRTNDIRSLQQISAIIGTVYDRGDLIKKALEQALEILQADFTWIDLKEEDHYSLAACSGIETVLLKRLETQLKLLRGVIEDKDEVMLIHDIHRDRFFRHGPRPYLWGGSLLVAPIRFKHEIRGMMFAGKREPFGFVEESRGLFRAFCNQVAIAFENARLVEISIEREVYKEELRVAHQAQMRLLPQRTPELPELEVSGFCLTANDIGGDFYDYVEIGKHRLDVVIGDVSGKGAAAAFYMAELKGIIQSLAAHFKSPRAMLIQINDFLKNHMERNMFVTMLYLMFDLTRQQVLVARAGHEPAGHIQGNEVRWIEKNGIGLGLADHELFSSSLEEEKIPLVPGDRFFLYTDGLIEIRNPEGDEFGTGRLTEMLQHAGAQPVQAMNKMIRDDIGQFAAEATQQDDMTAVMIEYTGNKHHSK